MILAFSQIEYGQYDTKYIIFNMTSIPVGF